MKKIWKWIRTDGLLHIETCALIAVACGALLPWWAAGLISAAAGVGKELWDTKHGVFDTHDLICDGIGILIGIAIILITIFL